MTETITDASALPLLGSDWSDPIEAERNLSGFEQLYLSGRGVVVYQFVHLSYDPLVRIRSGEIIMPPDSST